MVDGVEVLNGNNKGGFQEPNSSAAMQVAPVA